MATNGVSRGEVGRMRQHGNGVRPGAFGVGGAALLLLLSACGSSGSAGSADRLGTPVASVDTGAAATSAGGSDAGTTAPTEGPEGAIGRAVLSTYQAWWDAQGEAFGRSDSDGSQLRSYSVGKALTDALATLNQLRQAGLVMTGSPHPAPVVKTLDLSADPQTAVVEDCLDVSSWHQADASTRELKDPKVRFTRYVATVSLQKYDSRWMVVDFEREVERTC